ncbi:helix-turn-helix domain-containing protein (plasmid) [Streptomyces sp. BI20]|uniref:helix-turn-helix domain-containing protein n=1 Tax=Streptomyces sp. BI20 TaxID=3403460 RepID=UPI003C75465B
MSDAGAVLGGVDEYRVVRPHPALRPWVASLTGYRQRGLAPAEHLGLPSPYLTLILTLHEPLTVRVHPDPRQPAAVHDALLGGLHTRPALVTHDGAQSGVQIALGPLGARVLLGLPAGELAGLDLAAADVLGDWAERLRVRMLAAPDWPARFDAVDAALLDLLTRRAADRARPASPEVVEAWRLLRASAGALPAAALADRVGWSGRHLASRFRAEIGLTPKVAGRVVRFDRARRLLAARAAGAPGTAAGLGVLAADCGYFDQAHLAREFRAFAGLPPSEWLSREFRSVQAGAAPPGPRWEDGAEPPPERGEDTP